MLARDEYKKRLRGMLSLDFEQTSSVEKTHELLEKKGNSRHTIVILDEDGKQHGSDTFHTFLANHLSSGCSGVVFAFGPADGWPPETKKLGDHIVSLSKLTFTSQLAEVVLLEQLYRGMSMIRGTSYHRGA